MSLGQNFLAETRHLVRSQKDLADKAIAQLADAELFWQPNAESNSVAILMKHMAGNMLSRWTDFLTSDGEKPDRNRDGEFIVSAGDLPGLRAYWERGYGVFFATLEALTEQDLLKTVTIRREPHTVIGAIQRQVSHYGYHVGQIVFLAKLIKNDAWKTLSIPRGKSREFVPPGPVAEKNQ